MKVVWYDNTGVARRLMFMQPESIPNMAALPYCAGLTPYDCANTPEFDVNRPGDFPPLSEFTGSLIEL